MQWVLLLISCALSRENSSGREAHNAMLVLRNAVIA